MVGSGHDRVGLGCHRSRGFLVKPASASSTLSGRQADEGLRRPRPHAPARARAVHCRRRRMIAYTRVGTGPSLVLLHGIGLSRQSWDPVLAALAQDFDVLAIDLPG